MPGAQFSHGEGHQRGQPGPPRPVIIGGPHLHASPLDREITLDSRQPVEQHTVHPTLGPGVAILDDRRRTKLRLIAYLCLLPLGVMGLLLGRQDNAGGGSLLGLAEVFGSLFLGFYGLQAAVVDAVRLTNPVRLLIARDGFETAPGHKRLWWPDRFPNRYPVLWADLKSIGDTKHPDKPEVLRFQLRDPQRFVDANHLTLLNRVKVLLADGDLAIGNGLAVTVPELERLMRERLGRSHGPSAEAAIRPAAAPKLGRRRRSARR